ncbi:MAG: VWA domain-containing protein [Bacteroidia bacterium]|nr:VWA domain-containing protein [Bacteroidia bacterium]MCZ2249691.1 VWA domain-containing protein [Bacteroidia bacterium]
MKKLIIFLFPFVIIFGLFLLMPRYTFAQKTKELPKVRILFVFDCSLSMIGKWESATKMDVSKSILSQTIDSLALLPNVEVALRMYGHQYTVNPKPNCEDTKLEVPFGKNNATAIKNKIKGAQPKGTTPIAYTLEQCGNDFPDCSNCRNIIILITDGVEECNGDPCAVSLALQSRGIALRPFVIGVGLDINFKKTFECVGKYFDAANEKSFKQAMGVIISQALNSTTVQVNLLDANAKPSETDVNMTLYDAGTGAMKYNLIHTMNNAGNPDTLPIDPLPTYNLTVHTIPPVEKQNIELIPGKHNTVAVYCPQGFLNLKTGFREYKQLNYIVRKSKEMNTLIVAEADKPEKLITGLYDIEILTMPRIYVSDVEISQSRTTTIQIPQPGVANILFSGPGAGSLFIEEKNKLKWLYNFPDNPSRETLVLQPGKYKVVFRPKSAKESIYTIERDFIIDAGSTASVKMY